MVSCFPLLNSLLSVWRKGNPPTPLVRMQTGIATMEDSVKVP